MITRIRDVRKAKGLTLEDVAQKCAPPTTAQTIGRLETGTRTVSIAWLNRIANALGVTSADLVDMPGQTHIPVAALLGAQGAHAPSTPLLLSAPLADGNLIAVRVDASLGDYRAGDEIWCHRTTAEHYDMALNRDVLIPRPAGRFLFGRMIARENGLLQILPLTAGSRQQVVADPPWLAVASRLLRAL